MILVLVNCCNPGKFSSTISSSAVYLFHNAFENDVRVLQISSLKAARIQSNTIKRHIMVQQ